MQLTGGGLEDSAAVAAKTVQRVPGKEESGCRAMRLASTVLLEAEDAESCEVGDKV